MPGKLFPPWLFYTLMVVTFVVLTWVLFVNAGKFETPGAESPVTELIPTINGEVFKESMLHNLAEPVAMMLIQIIAILLVARVAGWIFIKMGQPTVIGEILAGIILGPSLLGYFSPETYRFLFAPESLGNLYILSQVGLILFMFVIGMELNLSMLKNKMGTTYVISHASIFIPYFLGMLFAYMVYEEFAANQTNFLSFALFIGISMSITAFPVLARIIQEKGLTRTHLGQISITCAAFDDVTAWCILAAVIAIAKTGSIASSLITIGLSIVFILFMLFVVRPFMKKIGKTYSSSEVLNKNVVAFIFLLLTLSAFATQLIGIHALFGAFLAGVIMPELPKFRKLIIEKIEDVALTLLLPLFFVYTGLRTEIGLLNTPYLWGVTLLLIGFAVAGKFLGGAVSARVMGESWRDSLSMGVLMNTRGLMEIVVLNIGYEMGILPKPIFVMLVLMALVTTFMTTPLLSLIHKVFPERESESSRLRQAALGEFRVLIALGNPENGKYLLRVARYVLDGIKNPLRATALHLSPGSDLNPLYSDEFASESFKGINAEARELKLQLQTEYKVADNVELGIVKTVNQDDYDFLLVGSGISLSGISFVKDKAYKKYGWLGKIMKQVSRSQEIFYPGGLLRDKTPYFVENSNCSTGIFINRNFNELQTVGILLQGSDDEFLIRYAHRILKNNAGVQVSIFDEAKLLGGKNSMTDQYIKITNNYPDQVKVIKPPRNNMQIFSKFSLLLISYLCWENLNINNDSRLAYIPSTLIIHKKKSRFSEKSDFDSVLRE